MKVEAQIGNENQAVMALRLGLVTGEEAEKVKKHWNLEMPKVVTIAGLWLWQPADAQSMNGDTVEEAERRLRRMVSTREGVKELLFDWELIGDLPDEITVKYGDEVLEAW